LTKPNKIYPNKDAGLGQRHVLQKKRGDQGSYDIT